jgi:tetratricopeptide (TPR) repeat protein
MSIIKSSAAALPALALAMCLSVGTALAAGEGGGGGSGGGSGGNSGGSDGNSQMIRPVKCKSGQVFDPQASPGKGKCVNAADIKKPGKQKQGMIYDYGKQLAKAGEYQLAIDTLRLAPDQNDPRVLNYLGYSHRKLGKLGEALEYYQAAVAQNPDFSLVREYLGEAYIQLGQLENARNQLTEIERICGGRQCSEYGQLADLIVATQAK